MLPRAFPACETPCVPNYPTMASPRRRLVHRLEQLGIGVEKILRAPQCIEDRVLFCSHTYLPKNVMDAGMNVGPRGRPRASRKSMHIRDESMKIRDESMTAIDETMRTIDEETRVIGE